MDPAKKQTVIPAAPRPTTTLPWIDWVRFLAALEVFLFHLPQYVFQPYASFAAAHQPFTLMLWLAVTNFGREAVIVFFALSGYLVGGGLIERVRGGSFRPATYAIDRGVRIMLPFVPAMLISVLLQIVKHEPVDAARTLGNLLALQGVTVKPDPYLGVDWSLAYEIWFYVLAGALAACCLRRGRSALAIGIAAISFLILSILTDHHLLFCWTIGALVSQIPVQRARWFALLGGSILCISGLVLTNSVFGRLRERLHLGTVNEALCDLLIALGMSIVIRNIVEMPGKARLARRFDAIGTYLARFSYSLYLMHIPFLAVLVLTFSTSNGATSGGLFRYWAYVVTILLAAYGFYWLFERHTDTARRWLKRRLGVTSSVDGAVTRRGKSATAAPIASRRS